MAELIFHPKTAAEINRYLTAKLPALIIQGQKGAGKETLAYYLAQKLLNISGDNRLSSPNEHILSIAAAKNQIGIDEIRKLTKYLRLKSVNANADIKRLVIINQAELMSLEAQNAILKILEEPPADSCIILTTSSKDKLLATIVSRCQILSIRPLTKDQVSSHFNLNNKDLDSLFNLSGGLAGLLNDMVYDQDNQLQSAVSQAKAVLNQNLFERLAGVDKLEKTEIEPLLNGLLKIAVSGSKLSVAKPSSVHRRWLAMLNNCQTAIEMFKLGVQHKLILSWLLMVL